MGSKLNIEELKHLIADYITGQSDEQEKALVENALKESAELREFYNEMKKTLEFVSTVKPGDPPEQYWNTLLPRIHQRIDAEQAKKFSWDKISAVWKVLVPVAAVILIVLIYYLVKPSNTQITKDEQKNEKINKDTSKHEDENRKEEKAPEKKQEEKIVKEDNRHQENPLKKFRKRDQVKEENIAKEENKINEMNTQKEPKNEDVAVMDIEETSVFSMGEGAGLDEETESELKSLSDNDKDALLEELQNSNLN